MTGWGSIDTAVEAMRRGAKSFVQKPWEDVTLLEILEREIAEARAAQAPRSAKQQRELEDARLIQRGLLPTTVPQVAGIELAVAWQPANGVGGDCFDTLAFGGGARRLDRRHRRQGAAGGAADVEPAGGGPRLRAGNGAAPRRSAAASTACCAATWRAAGSRRSATRASTPPPGASSTRTPATIRRCSSAPTATIDAAARRRHGPRRLSREHLRAGGVRRSAPGDRLVFYTDGITEARNPAGEEYGEDRLADAASVARAASLEAMKDALLADVNAFTGGKFDDDATLIVVSVD